MASLRAKPAGSGLEAGWYSFLILLDVSAHDGNTKSSQTLWLHRRATRIRDPAGDRGTHLAVFPRPPNWLTKIVNQGARGVQLFFVTSALTLSMSWVARNENSADFYARRAFRIVPMFWIAIVFFLWLNGTGPSMYAPEGIGVRHVIMTALRVHGFWPDTITSVVPGGWSVADEVMFYALFPLVVPRLLRTH